MAEHTLKDKVAVIGGGEKNLGGLLSRTFAEAGAKVVVHYHTSEKEAEETVQAIRGGGTLPVRGPADPCPPRWGGHRHHRS